MLLPFALLLATCDSYNPNHPTTWQTWRCGLVILSGLAAMTWAGNRGSK